MLALPNTNRSRLATLIETEFNNYEEWLIPNLIPRRGLILHTATALHCKTTGIYHAAQLPSLLPVVSY